MSCDDPRRDKRLTRVCPRVTGERLMNLCYASLSGDTLAEPAPAHRGRPDAIDPNGHTKRDTYRAAMQQDIAYFDRLARVLSSPRWLNSMTSHRTFKLQGDKVRPIDLPSETKRACAAWVQRHLEALVKATGWLVPSVVGFREIEEFPAYEKRCDGVTIQDVFASTVWQLIEQHGPCVVLIDLKDAFGNLPHKAIHAALRALWVPHDDRRRVIELVRIRTTRDGKHVLKPRAYGIEQGNPLSPQIFNVVMSLVARRLWKVGIKFACYGDDVVLVAPTEATARKAFDNFLAITGHLGFKNVRPLGGRDEKSTKIYDTQTTPVPLIRTYLVGRGQIAMTPDKEMSLRENLSLNPSMNRLKEANTWKVASKSYLKTLLPGNRGEDSLGILQPEEPTSLGPATKESKPRPDHPKDGSDGGPHSHPQDGPGTQDEQSISKSDDSNMGARVNARRLPLLADKTPSPQPIEHPYPNSSYGKLEAPTYTGTLVNTTEAIHAGPAFRREQTGYTQGGRVSVVPVTDGGPEVGVAPDRNGGDGVEHHPSPPKTVLRISDADIQALAMGLRLRAGNRYRHERAVVDVRGLHLQVPRNQLAFAVGQVARASSVHGRVALLIHPGEAWTCDAADFAGLEALGDERHPCGLVLLFRRGDRGRRHDKAHHPVWGEPPAAEVVVVGARARQDDARFWSVRLMTKMGSKVEVVSTTSPNTGIARVEAIAAVLARRKSESVAVHADAILCQHLLANTEVRQVALHDALALFRRWTWTRAGGWLTGRLPPPSSERPVNSRVWTGDERHS